MDLRNDHQDESLLRRHDCDSRWTSVNPRDNLNSHQENVFTRLALPNQLRIWFRLDGAEDSARGMRDALR